MHPAEPLCPTLFVPVPSPPTEEAVEGVQDLEGEYAEVEGLEVELEETEGLE